MRSAPLTLSAPIAVTTTALNKSLVRITCRLGTRSTMTPPYSSSTSWVAVAIAKPAPSWAGVAPSEKNWKGNAENEIAEYRDRLACPEQPEVAMPERLEDERNLHSIRFRMGM